MMFQQFMSKSVAKMHTALKPTLYVFAGQGTQTKGMFDGAKPALREEARQVAKDIIGIDL